MSIFGVQYKSNSNDKNCLKDAPCCLTRQKPIFSCNNKKALLLDRCCEQSDCLTCNKCESESCKEKPKSAIIDGERVLRPWTYSTDQTCCCEPEPVCEQACIDECEQKTKIIQCRETECGSVIIKLLIFGGPDQCFTMFIDLPMCENKDSAVAFNARSISVQNKKCDQTCQVPCDFVQFKLDCKKSTLSGVHLTICLSGQNAPQVLLEKKGPCCSYVPFCLEFEVWREPQQPCCLDVETIVPSVILPTDCTVVDGCCTVNP